MIKKFLWALYAGFIAYSFMTLFSGSAGLSNMKALDYFKVNIVKHVEELEMKKVKLNDEITRLSSDIDRLKVAARPIGYVEQDQQIIKIVNSRMEKELYRLDQQYDTPRFKQKTNTILLVSTLLTVILFVISLFIGVIRDTFKRS